MPLSNVPELRSVVRLDPQKAELPFDVSSEEVETTYFGGDDEACSTEDVKCQTETGVQNGGTSMREKVEADTLSVTDLTYTVKEYQGPWWKGCCLRRRSTKTILNHLTLEAEAGCLTAIMGNSGSGKTSLLDVIAGRASGAVEGSIRYNGRKLTPETFRNVAGYVIQADRLLPNLTVKETLTYVAQIRFAGALDRKKIEEKVTHAVSAMGLAGVADSRIGGLIEKGISGGEKRRLSVAVQLLQDPKILLLDEPTTGLDSFMARHLVETLANLAHTQDKIILMSIHQPRSDIFRLIDTVGILTTGEIVYFGPTNKMVPYFTDRGHPCPDYANPLDHYIDVASVDRRSFEVQTLSVQRVNKLKKEYKESDICHIMTENIKRVTEEREDEGPSTCSNITVKPLPGLYKHLTIFWAILRRMFQNLNRDRSGLLMRLGSMIAFAAFLWIFLFRLTNRFRGIQDRTGLMYQTCAVPPSVGLLNCVGLFPTLRDLYYRDRRDGLYGCVVFVLAYFLHVIPFHIISSMGFAVWVYWGIGLYPEAERFMIYYYVIVMMQFYGEMQTVATLAVFNKPALGSSVSMLLNTAAVLYATGLIKTAESMLEPLKWLANISPFKWSAQIIVANEYRGLKFTCDAGEPCPIRSGDEYLQVTFPHAVQYLHRNMALLPCFVLAALLISIIFFRIRGNRTLY